MIYEHIPYILKGSGYDVHDFLNLSEYDLYSWENFVLNNFRKNAAELFASNTVPRLNV